MITFFEAILTRLKSVCRSLPSRLRTLWTGTLRFHRGKILGAVIGLILGLRVFGLLFGLLAGYLVDTIIKHHVFQRKVQRFSAGGDLSGRRDFTEPSDLSFTSLGRVAAATICAMEAAAHAKRQHAEHAGKTGEWEDGGGKGDARPSGILDEHEIGLVKQQVKRSFALSPAGVHAAEAVRPWAGIGESAAGGETGGGGREGHGGEASVQAASGGEASAFEQLLDSAIVFSDPPEQFALMQCLFEAASIFGPVRGSTRRLIERVREAFSIPAEIGRMAYLIYADRDVESYRLLGLEPEAPLRDIKRAYRALAVQFHPDSLHSPEPHQQEAAENAFLRIREAYEVIMRERLSEDDR